MEEELATKTQTVRRSGFFSSIFLTDILSRRRIRIFSDPEFADNVQWNQTPRDQDH